MLLAVVMRPGDESRRPGKLHSIHAIWRISNNKPESSNICREMVGVDVREHDVCKADARSGIVPSLSWDMAMFVVVVHTREGWVSCRCTQNASAEVHRSVVLWS